MSVSTQELYEQAKRVIRGSLPLLDWSGPAKFVLACRYCGQPFPDDIAMGVVTAHIDLHGDVEHHLDLVWIGEGPPPKGNTG